MFLRPTIASKLYFKKDPRNYTMKAIQPIIIATLITLTGCATGKNYSQHEMISESTERVFTYDYSIPKSDKNTLWKRARDYFAATYGDSRAVFRIQDESDGILIGKGIHTWIFADVLLCSNEYHVRFAAKNEKARLQFELIQDVPALSKCLGYPLPSKVAYQDMVKIFSETSSNLEKALTGEEQPNDFKNF